MCNEVEYNKVIKKLISIEDKIVDIDKIAKMLDIWVKDNNYKLIPAMNMLNGKIKEALKVIER